MTSANILIPRPLLHPLTDTANVTHHWVADDWVSGSWVDRKAGVAATLTGTPLKQASAQFTGRKELYSFSASNYFTVPSGQGLVINTNTTHSWEFMLRCHTPLSAQYLAGRYPGGGMWYFLLTGVYTAEFGIVNNASGYFVQCTGAYGHIDGQNYLFAATVDLSVPRTTLYCNGVQIQQVLTTSGTLGAADASIGLGEGIGLTASPFLGGLLEVLHHSIELSPAQATSRAAQFNALKGY